MGKLSTLMGVVRRSKCYLEQRLFQRCLSFDARASEPEEVLGSLELWTWGKGESGQLGLGDEETRTSPCLVQSLSLPSSCALAPYEGLLSRAIHASRSAESAEGVGITCGLFHSGLWTDGKLWTWGKGAGGRLGLGSEEPQYNPTQVSSLTSVKSVAFGGLHSAAIADGGSLYTWGFGGFGALGHGLYSKEMVPRKLTGEGWMENVKHVAAGGSHTAAISSSGELYTWGRDEGEGRLGQGEEGGADEGAQQFPVKVEALPVAVAAVACGGFCTMAVTAEGQLWSWGGNSNYELGRGDRRDDWRPKPIPETENTCIIQVACGGYHAAGITDDGKLLTWGHGGHGQLGHGSLSNGRVPCVVEALANQRVVAVACGGSWTAAVTVSGELYTWGKNRDCQLGVPGLTDTQMTPVLVSFEETVVRDGAQSTFPHVLAASAGATHGMSLIYRKRC